MIAGKYRVERWIGEGGNGVVVAATHLALNQAVAIKWLNSAARANPDIVERFEREGRLAAQIASEHVVRVYDVGELEGVGPYLVMEFLRGRNLSELLGEHGPLGVAPAVHYLLQACDALARAHAISIIHCDIKPENLVLADGPSRTPVVKVIDFGVSKVAAGWDLPSQEARLTSENARIGTPPYMSPEQLRSTASVDPRTDIWALGVTLFELLTGALPFEGTQLPQLCTNILHSAPLALTRFCPGAPRQLEAIILRCLEKDPAHRFRDVAELASELAPFAGGPGVTLRSIGAMTERTPLPSTIEIPRAALRPAARAGAVHLRHNPLLVFGAGAVSLFVVALFAILALRGLPARTQGPATALTPTAARAPEPPRLVSRSPALWPESARATESAGMGSPEAPEATAPPPTATAHSRNSRAAARGSEAGGPRTPPAIVDPFNRRAAFGERK